MISIKYCKNQRLQTTPIRNQTHDPPSQLQHRLSFQSPRQILTKIASVVAAPGLSSTFSVPFVGSGYFSSVISWGSICAFLSCSLTSLFPSSLNYKNIFSHFYLFGSQSMMTYLLRILVRHIQPHMLRQIVPQIRSSAKFCESFVEDFGAFDGVLEGFCGEVGEECFAGSVFCFLPDRWKGRVSFISNGRLWIF